MKIKSYKIKIMLLLLVISLSCSNDDNFNQSLSNSHRTALFLEQSTPQFSADFNGNSFSWLFGFATYQMSSGYIGRTGNPLEPNRYLQFVLNQENGNNQFIIKTPIYDASSTVEFNRIFGTGEKAVGNFPDDYEIIIRMNGKTYKICEQYNEVKLEILKTEEYYEEYSNNTYFNVWYKIDTINLDKCDSTYQGRLDNGFILARFYGHDF